jgi:hypothetical protein
MTSSEVVPPLSSMLLPTAASRVGCWVGDGGSKENFLNRPPVEGFLLSIPVSAVERDKTEFNFSSEAA